MKAKLNYDTTGQIAPRIDIEYDRGQPATKADIFALKDDQPKRNAGILNGPRTIGGGKGKKSGKGMKAYGV